MMIRRIPGVAFSVVVLLALGTTRVVAEPGRIGAAGPPSPEADPVTYQGKPAAFWLRKFKDRDPAFRVEALKALKGIGEVDASVHPVLIGALKDPAECVRLAAVRALTEIGRDERAVRPALLGAVWDRASDVRVAAIRALRELGMSNAESLRALCSALKDPVSGVRDTALDTLAGLGPAARSTVPEVIASLRYSDDSSVVPTLQAIDPTGEMFYSLLIGALTHKDPTMRERAAVIVGSFSGQSIGERFFITRVGGLATEADRKPPLQETIKEIRGKKAGQALPLLVAALKDPAESVRTAALGELSELGPAAAPAIPALMERLRVEHTGLSGRIHDPIDPLAKTFRAVDPKLRKAPPLLIEVLRDKNAVTRRNAIRVLSEWVWEEATKTLPALPELAPAVLGGVKDPDDEVRRAALLLLRVIGPESRAVSILLDILRTDKCEKNRAAAAEELGRMESAAGTVVPALVKALEGDTSIDVRRAAVRALGTLGPKAGSALHPLVIALTDPDYMIRRAAVDALGALGPDAREAVEALVDAAKDPDDEVRKSALQALERIDVRAARSARR